MRIGEITENRIYEGGSGQRKKVIRIDHAEGRPLISAMVTFEVIDPNPQIDCFYKTLPVGTQRTRHIGDFAKWSKVEVSN